MYLSTLFYFLIAIIAPLICTSSYIDVQNTVLCDILSSTNIRDIRSNGTNNITSNNWNCTADHIPVVDPCSFHNVWPFLRCIDNSTMVGMNLTESDLTGTLPSSIGDLSALLDLTVSNNQMTGSLPSEVGKLGLLTSLVVTETSISGSIPTQIADMSSLEYLILSSNLLEGSVPSALCSITSLNTLSVSYNPGITCLDICVTSMSAGASVSVSLNQTGYSLMSCALVTHWLSLCDVMAATGWGTDFQSQDSNSESWRCHGRVPFSDPCSWTTDSGSGTVLTPIVCEAGGAITKLDLAGTTAGPGTLPSSIGALTALTKLKIVLSSLTGEMPSEIGSLTGLSSLYLSSGGGVALTGSIPETVGSLTRLTALTLSSAALSGTMPESLGSLQHLVYLSVTGNSLSGSVPSSLCGLTALTGLDVTSNTDMTCYSDCLSTVEVFPRDYTIAPANESPRLFGSCSGGSGSATGSSGTGGGILGVSYAVMFVFGGVILGCGICIRAGFLKPGDQAFARDVAEMRREEHVTACCYCMFHNPCCNCRTHHHRIPARRKRQIHYSAMHGGGGGEDDSRAEGAAAAAGAGRAERVLAHERSKVIPWSRSRSRSQSHEESGRHDEITSSPMKVASAKFDLS